MIHNYPTPYRLPLFDALAVDAMTEVWFCGGAEAGRRWSSESTLQRASARVLRSSRLGPFIINWSLPLLLARADADAIVLAEDLSTVVASVVASIYARVRGVPLVLWSEHVPHRPQPRHLDLGQVKSAAYVGIRKWILRSASTVVAMSGDAGVRQIRRLGYVGRVWAGPQVIPDEQLPVPTGAARSERVRLLFLGYLRPEKNVVNLVEVFRSLGRDDAELIIAGDGPERHRIEEVAYGASNVHLVGHLEGSSKARAIEMAHALVLPSTYEPWGLVVNEALSLATPVLVSSDAGSAQLIREGDNGLTFDPSVGADGIAEVIRRYLSDPELRSRLQTGASSERRSDLSSVEVGTAHLLDAIWTALERDNRLRASY